jgi:hypothetical protein
MLSRRLIAAILALFLSGSFLTPAAASFSPEKECLRLSLGEGERRPDGSVILPLKIRFGRFPAGNGNPTSMSGLNVRYTLATGENWCSGESRPEPADDGTLVARIRVGAGQRLIVRATASSRERGRTIRHDAVACYQRLGRAKPGGTTALFPSGDPLDGPLEIRVSPPFNYWRQTGQPLGIFCRNRIDGAPCSTVTILDEHLPPESVVPDATGAATHTPADDAVLNGLEERSGKETLLVAEEGDYRATFALELHRNRTAHQEPLPGLLTLGCSCGLTVLAVTVKRRKTA